MNNILTIVKNIEDKNGNLIFQVFAADAVILFIKVTFFLLIMYIGKICVKLADKYIDKISLKKIDKGAKQFTKSFIKLGIYTVFFFLECLCSVLKSSQL